MFFLSGRKGNKESKGRVVKSALKVCFKKCNLEEVGKIINNCLKKCKMPDSLISNSHREDRYVSNEYLFAAFYNRWQACSCQVKYFTGTQLLVSISWLIY